MKISDLLPSLRTELGDSVLPYFWPDKDLISYLNEAQVEFCVVTPGIRDSRTAAVCSIDYLADDFEVAYHPSIKRIISAQRLDSNGRLHRVPLKTQENTFELSPVRSDYGIVSTSAVTEAQQPNDYFSLFTDYDEGYIRFSSPAQTDGTLKLQVDRLPLVTLTNSGDDFEVRDEARPALIAWATYRAWIKQDAETFDQTASNRALERFYLLARQVGTLIQSRRSQPGTVVYGGL